MTNNDILRRLRFVFNFNNSKMISIIALANITVDRDRIRSWLKKDDELGYMVCQDFQLAAFLNGLIIHNRGKKEGAEVANEPKINYNMIFRKLKIALELQDFEVVEVLDLAGFTISKHELSSFFRKEGHRNYRRCETQVLRNFLNGLQRKYRPVEPTVPVVETTEEESDEDIDSEEITTEPAPVEKAKRTEQKPKSSFTWKTPKKK